MAAENPLASSFIVYGSILLAGMIAVVILVIRSRLHAANTAREAALLVERQKATDEMNRQAMDLAHQQGLHMVGALTSSIAYEFNNLLTPIMGYSMLALESISPEEEDLYDNLLEIYEAAVKAKEIISRLSSVTRKKSTLLYKFVELDGAVREALEAIHPLKGANITVETDLKCGGVYIFADETRLHQMLLNLCVNGLQAMEEYETGVLRLSTTEDGVNAFLAVEDTGCGIQADKLGHIFDPFFTTKEARRGTGLGLAIVEQVVGELKAEITVESEEGKGTKMLVRIPLPGANEK